MHHSLSTATEVKLWALQYLVSLYLTLTATLLKGGGIAITPISEQELSHREVKPISQGLTAKKW